MLYIIKTWYGMTLNLPVTFTCLAFIALGIYAAVAIKSLRTLLYLMAGTVLLYFACSPVSVYNLFGVGVYSTFLGGVSTLVLFGCIMGLFIRAIRETKPQKPD